MTGTDIYWRSYFAVLAGASTGDLNANGLDSFADAVAHLALERYEEQFRRFTKAATELADADSPTLAQLITGLGPEFQEREAQRAETPVRHETEDPAK